MRPKSKATELVRIQSNSKLTENAWDLTADLWAEGPVDALHSTKSSIEKWDPVFVRNPSIAYLCSLIFKC